MAEVAGTAVAGSAAALGEIERHGLQKGLGKVTEKLGVEVGKGVAEMHEQVQTGLFGSESAPGLFEAVSAATAGLAGTLERDLATHAARAEESIKKLEVGVKRAARTSFSHTPARGTRTSLRAGAGAVPGSPL